MGHADGELADRVGRALQGDAGAGPVPGAGGGEDGEDDGGGGAGGGAVSPSQRAQLLSGREAEEERRHFIFFFFPPVFPHDFWCLHSWISSRNGKGGWAGEARRELG